MTVFLCHPVVVNNQT